MIQETSVPRHPQTPCLGIICLLACLSVTAFIKHIVFPIVLILAKWTIIGKYREGRYPVYGVMYLRWWIVDVLMNNCLNAGIFEWDLNLFYRLLGARIGPGAKIA